MRILILISLLLISVGCSSTMVTSPTSSKYAPKGHNPIGVVKYLNQGADSIIAKRREDAFKKMYNACSGKYEIVSEGSTKGDASYYRGIAGSIDSYSSEYWVMEFKCNKN